MGFDASDCIDGLQHVADTLGKSPTMREYDEHRRDKDPSSGTIINRLGSWNEAKKEAGLSLTGVHTEKDCIKSLKHVRDELGKSPTNIEYRENRRDTDPSVDTIRRMFGSWNDGLRVAGLDVNLIRNRNPTEEGCLEALKYVTDELGRSPKLREYRERRRDTDPSVDTISRMFGSWNDAKRAADLLAYQDGNGVNYPYGPSWHAQREAALTRDGECQHCELSDEEHRDLAGRSLDVHHLHKLRGFFDSLSDEEVSHLASDGDLPSWLREEMRRRTERANDLSNLVALCRGCHIDMEKLPVEEQVSRLGIENPDVSPDVVHIRVEESGQSSLGAK